MLTLLATILAFGIDSSIEEFHSRLNIFQEPKKTLPEECHESKLELEQKSEEKKQQ
jgi:hypothetical protein